jgi:hypothetical protein
MEPQSNKHEDDLPRPEVAIKINNGHYKVHRGQQSVADIKKVGAVPLADDLEQIVSGKLKPLPDDGFVTINGGEQFISHPKGSGSS